MRKLFVLIHRYVGLAMTVFLILVGLTGSVLAFYQLVGWANGFIVCPTTVGPAPSAWARPPAFAHPTFSFRLAVSVRINRDTAPIRSPRRLG